MTWRNDAPDESGAYRERMRALGRLHRAARHHPHVADVAMAAIVFAATLLMTTGQAPREGISRGAATLVAAVACGALALRRLHPFTVLLVSLIAAEIYLALYRGRVGTLVLAAPLIALYTVADTTGRRRSLMIGGLAVLALGGFHTLGRPASWLGPENVALAALGGLAVAAGSASRSRRAYLAEVEERARRAEDERAAEARRLLTEERLRIARDLHDSVGHHLALINVQAGVAAHVLDQQPVKVREALGHIRQGSRAALDELRDTIGLLRQPGDSLAPTEPAVGLTGLDDLVASFRRSGLRIDHQVEGASRPLPLAVDLAAYRIIQESLTNACKHAAGGTVRLALRYGSGAVHLTVDNDGPAVAPPPAGSHGILGMRERVAAIGGELHAGPRSAGGFRVTATLPTSGWSA